jgi:hypothetical protein
MLLGLVFPALIALVTKESLPPHTKVLILLLLTTISGVLSSLLGSVPTTLAGWEHVALNILMTFLAAAAADVAGWKPSGATKAIIRHTSGFGIGPKTPSKSSAAA